MKIITKVCTPRRTGLIDRVRRAKLQGLKSIPLKTAVDVYGAENLGGHFRKIGINIAVRRYGKNIRLIIEPKTSMHPFDMHKDKPKYTKMRNALGGLKPGQCLVISTPLEAHSFCGVRTSIRRKRGVFLRQMRNCTALWVWKDNSKTST